MDHDAYPDSYIRAILADVKTIALVGVTDSPVRASNIVARYMIAKGYRVYVLGARQDVLETTAGAEEFVHAPRVRTVTAGGTCVRVHRGEIVGRRGFSRLTTSRAAVVSARQIR